MGDKTFPKRFWWFCLCATLYIHSQAKHGIVFKFRHSKSRSSLIKIPWTLQNLFLKDFGDVCIVLDTLRCWRFLFWF